MENGEWRIGIVQRIVSHVEIDLRLTFCCFLRFRPSGACCAHAMLLLTGCPSGAIRHNAGFY